MHLQLRVYLHLQLPLYLLHLQLQLQVHTTCTSIGKGSENGVRCSREFGTISRVFVPRWRISLNSPEMAGKARSSDVCMTYTHSSTLPHTKSYGLSIDIWHRSVGAGQKLCGLLYEAHAAFWGGVRGLRGSLIHQD
ncbi:hypothetical protein BKA70DRAFT_1408049 [Coprinopsis sp. MPI-PUGE-AT-0042]|nr:hypothetical protein BKA70DRAFT_1408049 [Coprinopsis sp. MPI-PUGE-AT-0042]